MSHGLGLVVSLLLPLAFLLFGVVSPIQSVSGMLLLAGAWTVAFGIVLAKKEDRLYYSGSGLVAAILSTFLYLPFQYTVGLVVLAIVGVILASVFGKRVKA